MHPKFLHHLALRKFKRSNYKRLSRKRKQTDQSDKKRNNLFLSLSFPALTRTGRYLHSNVPRRHGPPAPSLVVPTAYGTVIESVQLVDEMGIYMEAHEGKQRRGEGITDRAFDTLDLIPSDIALEME